MSEGTRKKILIIDEDPRVREAVGRWLSQADFEVVSAARRDEGLRVLSEDPSIDLVLSDVVMPEMDGIETLRLLQSDTNLVHLRTIVMPPDLRSEFEAYSQEANSQQWSGSASIPNPAEEAETFIETIQEASGAPFESMREDLAAGDVERPVRAGEIRLMCLGLLDVIRLAGTTKGLPPSARDAMRSAEKLAERIERSVAAGVREDPAF